MSNKQNTTTTTTRVNVREALNRATELTAEEERVLRMRYGVSVQPTARLELKGQDHAETRAKLAHIEKLAIDAMSTEQPAPAPAAANSAKARMIQRLRDES